MVICQGSTRSELPWGLLALCRRTLGSERRRYTVAWPDKLGTDPMTYGGFMNGRRRGNREEPRKYAPDSAWVWRWAGWRETGRLNPSRETKFSGTHGDRGILFSLFSWPRAGLATLPGWSILCYMWWPYLHTYIYCLYSNLTNTPASAEVVSSILTKVGFVFFLS